MSILKTTDYYDKLNWTSCKKIKFDITFFLDRGHEYNILEVSGAEKLFHVFPLFIIAILL